MATAARDGPSRGIEVRPPSCPPIAAASASAGERGYERLEEKLQTVGADIERARDG
jgi:hypothetical protein